MEKIKTILDREKLSSSFVNSKQDFKSVKESVNFLKKPLWKSPLFYGPVGLAGIALGVTIVNLDSVDEASINQFEEIKIAEHKSEVDLNNSVHLNQILNESKSKPEELAPSSKKETKVSPVINDKKTSFKKEISIVESNPQPRRIINAIDDDQYKSLTPVNTSKNMMPNIAGVFTGDIPFGKLCSDEGIVCNSSLKVVSFHLECDTGRDQYGATIKGNKIPLEICEDLNASNNFSTIFITQFRAEDISTGKIHTLSSMSLNPK